MVNRTRYRDITFWPIDSVTQFILPSVDIMPTMAADSQDWFVVSASSVYSGYAVYKAFDKVADTSGYHSSLSANNWIMVQLPASKIVTYITLRTRKGETGQGIWWWSQYVFAWSNDWTNFTTLWTFNDSTANTPDTNFSHEVTNGTAYTYYKMTFVQNSFYLFVSECTLLGY